MRSLCVNVGVSVDIDIRISIGIEINIGIDIDIDLIPMSLTDFCLIRRLLLVTTAFYPSNDVAKQKLEATLPTNLEQRVVPTMFDSRNNRTVRTNGYRASTRLPYKPELRQAFSPFVMYKTGKTPAQVDLRPYMTPVEDQSQIGSCVANAVVGAYEYLHKRETGQHIDVSRLFVYYNGRTLSEEPTIKDEGVCITHALEALMEYGVCLESIWPYDIKEVNTKPNRRAYAHAQRFKIKEAYYVEKDLHDMKSCLAQGFPFVFSCKTFESFQNTGPTGIISLPDPSDNVASSHGIHAMLAVGYDDAKQTFIVRNSWGKHFGDHGYCYMPYEYLTSETLMMPERIYTVRRTPHRHNFGPRPAPVPRPMPPASAPVIRPVFCFYAQNNNIPLVNTTGPSFSDTWIVQSVQQQQYEPEYVQEYWPHVPPISIRDVRPYRRSSALPGVNWKWIPADRY
ncbi:unnamed protein product [Didymodactylos carnosus]|uniref:Peptidase C1A papain C-terminal domain-containing protein n=1 Tax=Didymodactylos carnosus TaxID=1234261 RepID=A0A814XJQ8_9BILA|nr:unnamed protein product [Didymodactylos carnosus]CAF1217574.1 unnamed protein product [Didymodactylos carnosus]CAF3857169.1 unnamed protein product [Didymodactylos carnosus]CAF3981154.1 unnamed protein product [Didymodactylos carnosus]